MANRRRRRKTNSSGASANGAAERINDGRLPEEDWRNRTRWNDYVIAVEETVARTSTQVAPWVLVEGNDNNFARIKIPKTVADRLEQRLHTSS